MGTLEITQDAKTAGSKEISIIHIIGSLDAHTAPQLDETLSQLVQNKKFMLIIDFSRLDYISSAGMGLFVGWIDNIRNNGGDISMVHLKPNVLKVFQILGFNRIFKIFDSEKEALETFS